MIAQELDDFSSDRAVPPPDVCSTPLWPGFANLLGMSLPPFAYPRGKREDILAHSDAWTLNHQGLSIEQAESQGSQESIVYPDDPPAAFSVSKKNVAPETATMAGPPRDVPALKDRFFLSAAFPRWGNLPDAVYGTDAPHAPPAKTAGYDPRQGAALIMAANAFLNETIPLSKGSWSV